MSNLPDGWASTAIAQICESITDGDHQPPPQVEVGVPFLVIGNVRNRMLNFADCRHVSPEYFESLNPIRRPQKGDVLYTLVGSYGIPVLVKDDTPFCVQRHIGILRPSREISASFLSLALSSRAVLDQATEFATGTAQLTVPLSGLRRIRVPLPPRPEQERIVAAIEEQFSRIDAGTAVLTRAVQNLKRMRAAVLQAVITDRAAAEYDAVRLGDVLREPLRNGHSAKANPSGQVRVFTLTAVTVGDFSVRNTKLTAADPIRVQNLWVQPGDLLIERSNTRELVGTARLYKGPADFAVYPDLVIRARVSSSVVLPEYAELVLQAPSTRTYFQRSAQGIAGSMPKVDQSVIGALTFPLPPVDVQWQIVQKAAADTSVIDTLQRALVVADRRRTRLKASMLAAAFSGRLVTQDPDEEPASALLARIAAERSSSNSHKPVFGRKSRTQVTA